MQMPKSLCLVQTGKILNYLKFLTLLFVFGFSQSVEEIINKIESNQTKITDLEAEIEIETSIQGKSEPLVQTIKIWQGKDEKGNPVTKTEMMIPTQKGEKEKVIMVMTKDSMITKRGNVVNRLPVQGQINTEGKSPQINTDMFKDAKEVKILRREGNTAVLEIVPNETEGIKIFDKAEIAVDAEKGVITSQKLFTPTGVIRTEMNYERQGDRGTGGQGVIWVLKEMKTITQYGMTVMRYKNIKVNKGIDKKKFEL